jgi:hypothetical protein
LWLGNQCTQTTGLSVRVSSACLYETRQFLGRPPTSGAGRLVTWETATWSLFPGPACRRGVVTGPVRFPVVILVQCFPVGNIWFDVPGRERQPRRRCFRVLVQCFFLPRSNFSSPFLQRKLEISKEKGGNSRLPFCQYCYSY